MRKSLMQSSYTMDARMKKIRTYSELIQFKTYEERYEYLRLSGKVGDSIWGSHRYLNQLLYNSPEWARVRSKVITRDRACDLGIFGYDIIAERSIIVHHMNPITEEDILSKSPIVFDPEYLITVSDGTHKDIHYGICHGGFPCGERFKNDTAPWKL